MPVNFFQDSGAGLGIKAFAIPLFADVDRGGEMDKDETTDGSTMASDIFAGRIVGSDRGANRDAAVLS
jgi:hypothetical protein